MEYADARVRFPEPGESRLEVEVFAAVCGATSAEHSEAREARLRNPHRVPAETTSLAFPGRTGRLGGRGSAEPA